MKTTLFGATGKLGAQCLACALSAGCDTCAWDEDDDVGRIDESLY